VLHTIQLLQCTRGRFTVHSTLLHTTQLLYTRPLNMQLLPILGLHITLLLLYTPILITLLHCILCLITLLPSM